VLDLHDRRRWLDLSDRLQRLEAWPEAIAALDNCHTIHFIYPWCGEAPSRGNPLWSKTAEVFTRMLPLVRRHGDRFDRAVIARQLRLSRSWAADA